jgi:hypothetical protein
MPEGLIQMEKLKKEQAKFINLQYCKHFVSCVNI